MRLQPAGTLIHWGENYPQKKAVTINGKTESYGSIYRNSKELANFLIGLGIKPSTRIGLICPNSFEYIEALFAIQIIGATIVPLDFSGPASLLKKVINSSKCKAVFIHPSYPEKDELVTSEVKTNLKTIFLGWGESINKSNYIDLQPKYTSRTEEENIPRKQIDFNDEYGLLFSSGTTNDPKGIIKTCYQFVSELLIWIIELGLRFEDTMLVSTPLFYTGGLILLSISIFTGAHIIILDPFDPHLWVETVKKNKVTHAFLSPLLTKQLLQLENNETKDVNSVKIIATISDATRGDLKLALRRRFKCDVIDVWGNTEGVGTILKSNDLLQKPDSIGKPFLTDETKIVNDRMEEVGVGVIGEIIGKTDSGFVGYDQQNELTSKTKIDGWILSGDLGWKDEDGYYYYAGRKSNTLKMNGKVIYPKEIERILEQHELIKEAIVFGVGEDIENQELICAVILRVNDNVELEFLRNTLNSKLNRITEIHDLVVYSDFPRTPAGKVIRQRLQEDYINKKDI